MTERTDPEPFGATAGATEPPQDDPAPDPAPEPEAAQEAADAPVDGVAEEVEDFTPAPGELVIHDPRDETAVLQVLDRHDELAILDTLRVKMADALKAKLFYSFPQDGQKVVELSVSGVYECANAMNATGKVNLAIDRSQRPEFTTELYDTDFAADVPHVVCTVYAHDERTGLGAYGTFAQARKFKLTERTAKRRRDAKKFVPDDLIVTDPFARQKALNKAERNALRKLVSEFVAQTLIAEYEGKPEAVKQIMAGPGAEKIAELPPPLTDEKAEAQKARARELYDELRDVDATVVLPAQFHVYLRDAEHSHERLDDFVKYLDGKLAEAKS